MKSHEKIAELREKGFDVLVIHERPLVGDASVFVRREELQESDSFSSKGGQTTVEISNRHRIGFGVATCRPDEGFHKRRGLDIALGRALKVLYS